MAAQLWGTNSLGGYFSNNTLSKKLRDAAQPLCRFRQFCDMKDAQGAKHGDLVKFDKVGNVATAGGALNETSTIPETNFIVSQGTATMTEYGNAIPFTGKLDTLSEFDVTNKTQQALRNDEAKVLDKACGAQFLDSDVKYVCLTASTGTLTTSDSNLSGMTSTSNLNKFHVKQIVDWLKSHNVPKYDGSNYVCIASTNALRGLYDDLEDMVKYTDKEYRLLGEVGRYYNVRFVEETNYLLNTAGHATTGTYGEAVFFGADAVMECVAVKEELRAKIPTDYGRSQGIAWYALLGWKKVFDYSADTEEHIVVVTDVFADAVAH